MDMQRASYIICATPRSGSTLLCDLLTDTEISGRPNSFFRHETFKEWAELFNVSMEKWSDSKAFNDEYLSSVLQQGSANTSVFGMRLMWENLGDLLKRLVYFYPNILNDSARFQSAFGSTFYIHLSRTDKVAQAISRLKAEQSGLWHIFADGTERERLKKGSTPAYDKQRISQFILEAEKDDAAWTAWFTQQNIEPFRLTYEDLSSEPHAFLSAVLSFLGLDPEMAATVTVRTSKLADSESLEWATRFRAESNQSS